MKFTIADENDMRYMLLCHLTMGNMEVIPAGSKQVYPSSVEFDTGVDNLEAPRRLIVWSAFMNSHICPAYIITFKAPFFGFVLSRDQISELPGITLSFHGSALTFPALFPILVKVIGPAKAGLIYKSLVDRKKCKITQEQMIQTTRRIIGNDRRLIAIIKSSIDKVCVLSFISLIFNVSEGFCCPATCCLNRITPSHGVLVHMLGRVNDIFITKIHSCTLY